MIYKPEFDLSNPDTEPGPYYVSVVDGKRVGFLAGPFEKHLEALEMVKKAKAKAIEVEPRAHFYAFGTIRLKIKYRKPRVLNHLLGLTN